MSSGRRKAEHRWAHSGPSETSARDSHPRNRRDFIIHASAASAALYSNYALASSLSPKPPSRQAPLLLHNNLCRLEFSPDHGGLRRITNLSSNDECLKDGRAEEMPFCIYADLTKEFDIPIDSHFGTVFDNPADICKNIIRPGNCRLLEATNDKGLLLRYESQGLEVRLRVVMHKASGISDWFLRITNTGDAPREFLVSFPLLDGLRLGADPKANLATAMDQGGLVLPAWQRDGGVLGESNQLSMQWHAQWDPASKSAFSVIFMDPDLHPKRLILLEPTLELSFFPPIKLAPGASVDLPPAQMYVYRGNWRPAARRYRAWYEKAYVPAEPPEWFKQSNGHRGEHFRKGAAAVLESFRDLPKVQIAAPLDNWEYAFYCRTSMLTEGQANSPHTDGVNIIREDLGGAEALRDGIAGCRKLGLHVTLYVEGYIVHEASDLAKTGKAAKWAVMQKNGDITGSYSKYGFYHMCPGCVEWREHLATMVARLLRETDADAIRLDSLGFYYLPCHNPAHQHESPFGYNQWLKQLLMRVRKAALEVKPDVLLLVEGAADWIGQWFHGALMARCPRDLPLMRLAVQPFRLYNYATGAVWGSLSGYPGGGCAVSDMSLIDWNWLCARFPVHEALVWGDVPDEDPSASDPQIVARHFMGKGYRAIVAARPTSQDPFVWPRGTEIADQHGEYSLTLPGLAAHAEEAILCDIEDNTWSQANMEKKGADLLLHLNSNWALVIVRESGGPAIIGFDAMRTAKRGSTTTLRLQALSKGSGKSFVKTARVQAHGLRVEPADVRVPGDVTIHVPTDAWPGYYPVTVSGENALGVKRHLRVE